MVWLEIPQKEKATISRVLTEQVTSELEHAEFSTKRGKNDEQANHYLGTKTVTI